MAEKHYLDGEYDPVMAAAMVNRLAGEIVREFIRKGYKAESVLVGMEPIRNKTKVIKDSKGKDDVRVQVYRIAVTIDE